MDIFDEIIKHVGSQAKLARLLGVSSMAVSLWKKQIPISRVLEIEKALNGKFTREQMRPDYYPPTIHPVKKVDGTNTILHNGGHH